MRKVDRSYLPYPTPPDFDAAGLDDNTLISMLRMMMRIRCFETVVARLVTEKRVRTPCHLYIGQEAVATGVCMALRKEDYVFGTHRSHGHYLAKGGNLLEGMAELFCRSTGCSKGRGGSMHLIDTRVGILGTSSIVAGSIPLAVGAGLAEFIRGSEAVSVVFHGDGVPEEGVWNESVNFAAVNNLPVIFVCENNLYCTHQPLEERRIYDNIPELARAHGVSGTSIDGNNVVEIYKTAKQVVKDVRSGAGPRLIECRTYRWLGHVGPKDNLEVGLRSQEEVDCWKARCPVETFKNYLVSGNHITTGEFEDLERDVDREVADAVEKAEKDPSPDPSTLLDHVMKQDA